MGMKWIIGELLRENVLGSEIIAWDHLRGGTSSAVAKIQCEDGKTYVVKGNEANLIYWEATFLRFYKDSALLPRLVYDAKDYLVYTFMKGDTLGARPEKAKMLQDLTVGLINEYKPIMRGWGWHEKFTWHKFLQQEIMGAEAIIGKHLPNEDAVLVRKVVKDQPRERLYFLHGDCGVHNFLFQDGQLCGVIDPLHLFGPPMYDLIFAFCSSPDSLDEKTLQDALLFFNGEIPGELYGSVLIGLYIRIARCLLHHPEDLATYLEAWTYWKALYYRQKNSTLRDTSVE
ncbi:hypothetical protein X559_2861 [Paenilisteria newyorkensis]|nr:hypothetical protein X559_2861 [Listeria newyorkensis]